MSPTTQFENSAQESINWGYVSGFLDSDGSITFMRRTRKGRKKPRYEPRLTWHNSSKQALQRIQKFISCGWICRDKRVNKYRQKQMFTLTVTKFVDIERVLKACIPFLVIKKDRAILMLTFCHLRLSKMINGSPFKGLKHGQTSYGAKEDALFVKVKELNFRIG